MYTQNPETHWEDVNLNMMKKWLCLILALLLVPAASALSEEVLPVTAAELGALLSAVRESIRDAAPLNDPTSEEAQSEDGVRFRYPTATLFLPSAEYTEDSPVNSLLFSDSEGFVLRSTGIDTQWMDLLSAYPLDNPELRGTRTQAVLYLRKSGADGFLFGLALRDGQRISAVEYGEVLPDGENYRTVSVTCSLQDGLITAIRVDGLNPDAAPRMDAASAAEMYDELEKLLNTDEYRAVRTSRTGTDLTVFGPEDLTFSGLSYTGLTPDALPGDPESELMDNEDGTWLLRCDGDGYEAVFRCQENGENPEILSFTILDDQLEGPRCVRLGDLFSDDYCRFRSENNDLSEQMTELLYGQEGVAPWGQAVFDAAAGETSLRYITPADGAEVELLLRYELNRLTEIMIRTR